MIRNGYKAIKISNLIFLFIICTLLCIVSCVDEFEVIEKKIDIKDFTEVSIGPTLFDVIIEKGDEYQVILTASETVMKDVEYFKEGDKFDIKLASDGNFSYSDFVLKVTITMPQLNVLNLVHSTCTITGFENFYQDSFYCNLDLSSTLEGEINAITYTMDTDFCEFNDFRGEGDNLNITLNNGSDVDLRNLIIKTSIIDIAGISYLTLNCSDSITGTLKTGSTLYYSGSPVIDVDVEFGSEIITY